MAFQHLNATNLVPVQAFNNSQEKLLSNQAGDCKVCVGHYETKASGRIILHKYYNSENYLAIFDIIQQSFITSTRSTMRMNIC